MYAQLAFAWDIQLLNPSSQGSRSFTVGSKSAGSSTFEDDGGMTVAGRSPAVSLAGREGN